MPIRAVVFDLFDTLVDLRWEDFPQIEVRGRHHASSAGHLHRAVARHVEIGFQEFMELMHSVDQELRPRTYDVQVELPTLRRMTALVERLGIDAPDLPAELTRAQMGLFRAHSPAPAHHPGVLAELAGRFQLGVCSNFSHSETAHAILAERGLHNHFDCVVVSDAVRYRKPRPEIFRATLLALGVEPHEALHVGDSLRDDVSGAAPLGMRTAWVTRRVKDPEQALAEHTGPPPDHRIADLSEVSALLE